MIINWQQVISNHFMIRNCMLKQLIWSEFNDNTKKIYVKFSQSIRKQPKNYLNHQLLVRNKIKILKTYKNRLFKKSMTLLAFKRIRQDYTLNYNHQEAKHITNAPTVSFLNIYNQFILKFRQKTILIHNLAQQFTVKV